jgi:hypothetical protein
MKFLVTLHQYLRNDDSPEITEIFICNRFFPIEVNDEYEIDYKANELLNELTLEIVKLRSKDGSNKYRYFARYSPFFKVHQIILISK